MNACTKTVSHCRDSSSYETEHERLRSYDAMPAFLFQRQSTCPVHARSYIIIN